MQGTTFEPKIIDSVKIIDGVSRALYIKGDEACPVSKGDSVYFYFTAYVIIGNSSFYIYDTNNKEDAKVAGLDTISRNFTPKGIIAGSGQVISGLDKGLLMCYLGEQSFLIFNSDLGYGSNSLGIVPPYSPLMFQVQIVGIKKN
jgi:FKBP-type peptidyl-prolyl cis-trans isomerase 2